MTESVDNSLCRGRVISLQSIAIAALQIVNCKSAIDNLQERAVRADVIRAAWLSLLAVAMSLSATAAFGQAAWEFSPYQVKVWLALEDRPELGGNFPQRIGELLLGRAEVVFGGAWQIESSPAPLAIATDFLARPDELTPDSMNAAADKVLDNDKIFLVAVMFAGDNYRIAVREVDGRTRQTGPAIARTAGQREAIGLAAWDAILDSFTPLAKVETVTEKQVQLRVRAGGLLVDPASPALIQPGHVLKPVLRRNDKNGQPMKNGIQPLDWTLLTVNDRTDALLDCTLHSGFRAPIPARGSARLDRLAFLAKPRYGSTRIILTARNDPERRLTGYEVFVKGQGKDETFLLGSTDWHGAVEIERSDVPFRMLYVRNGDQLLARLPLAPGFERELVAKTMEDDSRLQAEGFVIALHGRTVDLVAQREILVTQFRSHVLKKNLDQAREVLERFRTLDTRETLVQDLNSQLLEVTSSDPLTQKRIDKLFSDARKMLQNKFLDPELINVLQRELNAAPGAPATTPATTPAPPTTPATASSGS